MKLARTKVYGILPTVTGDWKVLDFSKPETVLFVGKEEAARFVADRYNAVEAARIEAVTEQNVARLNLLKQMQWSLERGLCDMQRGRANECALGALSLPG